MDVVSSVSSARRDGSVVSVVLASGSRHLISAARLADLRLAPGDALEADEVDALERAAADQLIEARLLRLLAARPRSRAELRRRLEGWEVPAGRAEPLLERLQRAGLLDDSAMADRCPGSLRRRGHGSLRAAGDLERLGVEDEAAAPAVAAHADAEPEIAARLLDRRYGPPPYDPVTTRRAAGLLLRQGFGEEAIAGLLGLDDTA